MYNDDIETLIEAKINIKDNIIYAMNELITWFESSIDKVQDFFRKVSHRLIQELKKFNKDTIIIKDVKYNDDIIFKKGTTVNAYQNGIKKSLKDLKINTDIVIKDSKKGISYIINDDTDRALYTRKKVESTLKNITAVGGMLLAVFAVSTKILKNKDDVRKMNLSISKMNQKEKDNAVILDADYYHSDKNEPIFNNRFNIFDDDDNDDVSGGLVVVEY